MTDKYDWLLGAFVIGVGLYFLVAALIFTASHP